MDLVIGATAATFSPSSSVTTPIARAYAATAIGVALSTTDNADSHVAALAVVAPYAATNIFTTVTIAAAITNFPTPKRATCPATCATHARTGSAETQQYRYRCSTGY